MRRKPWYGMFLCLVVLALCPGCDPPNQLEATPSGDTLYFALSTLPQYHIYQGSRVYAFDVEAGRLRLLSDHWAMNTWVSGSPDGEEFCYTRCHSQSHFTLHLQKRGEKDARQIGAVYNAYGAPHFVPGKNPHILAFEGRSLYLLNWTLFDAAGREVGLPIDASRKAVGTNTPAVASDRIAVPVYGLIKEYWKTGKKPWGIWIVVVDLAGGAPVATEAALFDVHHYETQKNFLDYPSIDLDFSPDGRRIVMSKYEHLGTTFYEIDASGKTPPRELFSDKQAYAPRWTSDGKGVVYCRKHPDPVKWNRLQAVLWRPEGGGPKPVAEFPGQVRRSGEVFRRLPDGRMRLAAFADDGIRIFDVNADGSETRERHLSRDMLGRQMSLAYFELMFNRDRKINQYLAPWEVMKHFYKMEQPKDVPREDVVARALETAWKENTPW